MSYHNSEDEAVLILVSTLFNICAFIINASDCQKAYLNPSAINTTIESRSLFEKKKCPFRAYTYSSDGLQVGDSDSSRVMSNAKPSPVKYTYGRGAVRGGGRGSKGDYSNRLRTSHLKNRKTRP